MRYLFSLVLMVFLLAQTWREAAVFTYYYFQKDFITENYCVNILRPELMCSGKCYLNEVLIDMGEANSPDSTLYMSVVNLPLWYLPALAKPFLPANDLFSNNHSFTWLFHYNSLEGPLPFRPPESL